MATIFRGLNVTKSLIDLDNYQIGLANIGLRLADLNLIRNVRRVEELNVFDFHQMSGLVDNQNRLFESQLEAGFTATTQIAPLKEVDTQQDFNLAVNDKIISSSFKYSYMDFNNPALVQIEGISSITASSDTVNGSGLLTQTLDGKSYVIKAGDTIRVSDTGSDGLTGDYTVGSNPSNSSFVLTNLPASGNITDFTNIDMFLLAPWAVKTADISTSRISSWSPVGNPTPDSYITYGARLEVGGEYLAATTLGVTEKPIEREFRAEIPTHNIRMNVNGQDVNFPVMKGIPLTWDFTGSSRYTVQIAPTPLLNAIEDSEGQIPISIKRQDVSLNPAPPPNKEDLFINGSELLTVSENGLNTASTHEFNIYYPPNRIGKLVFSRMNIKDFPFAKMENLTHITLNNGKFNVIPDFSFIAPSLTNLAMRNNKLFNGYQYLEELGLQDLASQYSTNSTNVNPDLLQIVSQAQVDRLPPTLEYVDLRDSFKGNVKLDYSHLVNIKRFESGSTSNRRGSNRITSTGSSPTGPDASYQIVFDPSDPSQYSVGGGVATFTVPEHKLANDDIVQYNYHAFYPKDNSKTLGRYVYIENSMGSALGGLAEKGKYKVHSVTTDTFKLKDINTDQTISSSAYNNNGELHTFVKWDLGEDDIHINYNIANGGIEQDKVWYSSYRYISRHITTSTNLVTADIYQTPITSVSGTPFVTGDYNSAARHKSNQDRKITYKSKNLTYYRNAWVKHNTVDLRGNQKLQNWYSYYHYPDPYFGNEERTYTTSDFNECRDLYHFYMYRGGGYNINSNERLRGNISGLTVGKVNLRYFRKLYTTGLKYTFDDNSFSGNQNKLFYIQMYGPRGSHRHDHGYGYNFGDFWGIDGRTNRTGKIFDTVKNSLSYIHVHYMYNTSVRYINDTQTYTNPTGSTIKIPIEDLSNLRRIWTIYADGCGRFPSVNGKSKLQWLRLHNNRRTLGSPQSACPGIVYRINTISDTNSNINYHNSIGHMFTEEFKDYGWLQTETDDALIDFAEGNTSRSSSRPLAGQHFRYTHTSIDNVNPGMWYIIADVGTGTDAQKISRWQNVGWTANAPYSPSAFAGYQGGVHNDEPQYRTGSVPSVGDIFETNIDATNLNRVALRHLQSGTQYRIVREGPDFPGIHTFETKGASSNNYGTVFTANSTSITTPARYGQFAEKHPKSSYTNLGGSTGAKVSRVSYSQNQALFNLGFVGNIPGLDNMSALSYVQIQRNSFSGLFPKPTASNLRELRLDTNYFSGNLPDMSAATQVREINCRNNRFNGYTPESFRFCFQTKKIDVSRNRLPASVAGDLIADLYNSALPDSTNPRKNVTVFLNNQQGFTKNGAGKYLDSNGRALRLSLQAIEDIPGNKDDPSHPKKMYNSLVGDLNWNISIDET